MDRTSRNRNSEVIDIEDNFIFCTHRGGASLVIQWTQLKYDIFIIWKSFSRNSLGQIRFITLTTSTPRDSTNHYPKQLSIFDSYENLTWSNRTIVTILSVSPHYWVLTMMCHTRLWLNGNLFCRCGSFLLLWVLLDTFLRYTKWLSWTSLLLLKAEIGTSVHVEGHMFLDPWRVCVFGTRPTLPENVFKYESVVMNGIINDFRERICNDFAI